MQTVLALRLMSPSVGDIARPIGGGCSRPLRCVGRRLFDLILALVFLVPWLVIFLTLSGVVLLLDGRPVFHVSRRVKAPGSEFCLIKFRTMLTDPNDNSDKVLGGCKISRVTRFGAFLRRTRLDELPQLLNVLVGDISFIGPRPPVPYYVEKFPQLYARVLRSKPGITGMATVMFHNHEAWLLSSAQDEREVELIYEKRCIPRKAWLDAVYFEHASFALDLYILWLTASKILPLPGRRTARLRGRKVRTPARNNPQLVRKPLSTI